MKFHQIFFLLLAGTCSLSSVGQSYDEIFQNAIEAVERGDYAEGDSLFTKLIQIQPTVELYFNRGIVRREMGLPCKFCEDMRSAYDFFRYEMAQAFIKSECLVSSDTVYLGRKLVSEEVNNKANFMQVEMQFKCDSTTTGVIYDLKRTYDELIVPGDEFHYLKNSFLGEDNVYGTFTYVSGSKVFSFFRGRIQASSKLYRSEWYKTLDLLRLTVLNRHPTLNDFDEKIRLQILIDEEGEIVSIRNNLVLVLSDLENRNVNEFLSEYLTEIIHFPKNRINGNPVKVIHTITF